MPQFFKHGLIQEAVMLDLKIVNGKVIDAEKEQLLDVEVGIQNGKIACIGRDLPDAERTIDAKGHMVSPGFIDIHMHEESFALTKKQEWDIAACMLRMGVTTAVGGNETIIGASAAGSGQLGARDGLHAEIILE